MPSTSCCSLTSLQGSAVVLYPGTGLELGTRSRSWVWEFRAGSRSWEWQLGVKCGGLTADLGVLCLFQEL